MTEVWKALTIARNVVAFVFENSDGTTVILEYAWAHCQRRRGVAFADLTDTKFAAPIYAGVHQADAQNDQGR